MKDLLPDRLAFMHRIRYFLHDFPCSNGLWLFAETRIRISISTVARTITNFDDHRYTVVHLKLGFWQFGFVGKSVDPQVDQPLVNSAPVLTPPKLRNARFRFYSLLPIGAAFENAGTKFLCIFCRQVRDPERIDDISCHLAVGANAQAHHPLDAQDAEANPYPNLALSLRDWRLSKNPDLCDARPIIGELQQKRTLMSVWLQSNCRG